MQMTNSWRALARMARDRMVGTNPEDVPLILSVRSHATPRTSHSHLTLQLWYIRLSSLARLRLFNQTSAECTNLFTVLNAIEPPATREWVFERILPFELEVLQAKTKYWAGDHMGYLDALVALLRRSKTRARQASARRDATTHAMWKERGARLCLIVASQLIEMKVRSPFLHPYAQIIYGMVRITPLRHASLSPSVPNPTAHPRRTSTPP